MNNLATLKICPGVARLPYLDAEYMHVSPLKRILHILMALNRNTMPLKFNLNY